MAQNSTAYLKAVTRLITASFKEADSKEKPQGFFKGADIPAARPPRPIAPIVQGSMGLLLHGVNYEKNGFENPGDVDILVSNLRGARAQIDRLKSRLEQGGGPIRIEGDPRKGPALVDEFTVVDATGKEPPLKIQIVDGADFGLVNVKAVEVKGIPVLPPKEAMFNLEYRVKMQGARPKDKFAYFSLLDKYGQELLHDETFSKNKEAKKFIKEYLDLPKEKRLAVAKGMKSQEDEKPDIDLEEKGPQIEP